jgi:hypothetical protein
VAAARDSVGMTRFFTAAALALVACAPTRVDTAAPGMPSDGQDVVVTYYYLNF